jgi:hypothetical protein
MPQSKEFPNFLPIEAERSGTIHLVMPSQVMSAAPVVVPKVNLPRFTTRSFTSRKSHHIQESEKMSTLALAGAALIAPLIWLGHALLVWLDVLKKQL